MIFNLNLVDLNTHLAWLKSNITIGIYFLCIATNAPI